MDSGYIIKKLNWRNINEMFNSNFNDEFSIDKILNKDVLQDLGFKDTIIYNYDCVVSDSIENVNIQLENIIEARFFSDDIEMRIFNDEGNFSGVLFKENNIDESEFIEEDYILYKRMPSMKKGPQRLKIRKYIDYDEDKQAYIKYVKPCKFI
ncbi:hypothetical protein KQH90_07115 [Anaerosalibacter bizertensis]|uniref:hypothetical protein n=1 Tax=Anaerosalibacter bizertensis TaxID=932217 RepID=UPI001C0EDD05|nr:hypothetical protein [Anaerosalibacter bizertensis]MBU5293802.1 hypothetical protein [Anaerosalibacter bizertensis]